MDEQATGASPAPVATEFGRTVVVGAGAVGSYFGAMLARAHHPVTLIGRAPHVQAIEARGLQLHMAGKVETVPLAATTDIAAVAGAALVLVCVKSTDTDAVARQIAPLLDADAVVLSMQNGVDNAQAISRHVRQPVVPAAVYVAVDMPAAGAVRHHGRGDLVIGPLHAGAAADVAPHLHGIARLFARAGVPVEISADVVAQLWGKLAINCACNAISGLAQAPYGRMAAQPDIAALQRELVREVVAVARAAGQPLSTEATCAAVERIAAAMPAQLSSTAQDMARGKPSEIDHLNGYIVRRGAELGVATPLNQALHALVKLVEAQRAAF